MDVKLKEIIPKIEALEKDFPSSFNWIFTALKDLIISNVAIQDWEIGEQIQPINTKQSDKKGILPLEFILEIKDIYDTSLKLGVMMGWNYKINPQYKLIMNTIHLINRLSNIIYDKVNKEET